MIPMYLKEKANAILITIGTSLMLLVPPIFSIILIMLNPAYHLGTNLNDENGFPWHLVLLVFSIISTILILVTSVIQSKAVIFQNLIYTLGFPIAGTIPIWQPSSQPFLIQGRLIRSDGMKETIHTRLPIN